MEDIKQFLLELNVVDKKIKNCEENLKNAIEDKSKIINSCEHDLVFVYNKFETSNYTSLWGKCLICGKTMEFKDKKEESLIDATKIVPGRTLKLYNCGDYCCAVRAQSKFLSLMKSNQILSREEIKRLILKDAIKYDHEIFDKFSEYTKEEINFALKKDDNSALINAINEECNGLVKKK